MTLIYHWTKHKLHRCEKDDCLTCRGGLAHCVVCNGSEGGMPTDCPGEKMHAIVADEVYNARLDYLAGRGWLRQPSEMWKDLKAEWRKMGDEWSDYAGID